MRTISVFIAMVLVAICVTAGDVSFVDVRPENANGNPLALDESFRVPIFIDPAHQKIHRGYHYTCTAVDILGDGDSLWTLITTPNTTKWTHMLMTFSGALHTDITVYRGVTNTAGAAMFCGNNNDNNTNVSGTVVNVATGATNGTLIFSTGFGVDAGFGANLVTGGGATRGDSERVLLQNTKYLVRILSSSAANHISQTLQWYDHTNKTD